jgi:hypothetical protein
MEEKKPNWIEVKPTKAVFLNFFMEPRNRFKGIDSASLRPDGSEPIVVDV